MRVKRLKTAKKYTTLYENTFDFRHPYKIIVDGEFMQRALDYKVYLPDTFSKLLDGTTKFYTTKCILEEIRDKYPRCTFNAKKYEVIRNCAYRHDGSDRVKCLMDMVSEMNKHRYMVATVDKELIESLEKQGCVPILSISKENVTMRKPSQKTFELAKNKEEAKRVLPQEEVRKLNEMFGIEKKKVQRKKRKKKNPNPLSVKKPKKEETKKRRRRRKKVQ